MTSQHNARIVCPGRTLKIRSNVKSGGFTEQHSGRVLRAPNALRITTKVKAGGFSPQHNARFLRADGTLKVRANIKAGGFSQQHNGRVIRALGALKVRTNVKAAGYSVQHNGRVLRASRHLEIRANVKAGDSISSTANGSSGLGKSETDATPGSFSHRPGVAQPAGDLLRPGSDLAGAQRSARVSARSARGPGIPYRRIRENSVPRDICRRAAACFWL